MPKRDPIKRLKDRYGHAIRYRIVQDGGIKQIWIIEVLLETIVIGRGEHLYAKSAKKIAAQRAEKFLDFQGSETKPKGETSLEQRQQRFQRAYGAQEQQEELGHIKERLLVEMMRHDPWMPERPSWLKSIRQGSTEEDCRGIDLIVETDRGEMPIQVKSSLGSALKHAQKSKIPVFIYSTSWSRLTAYNRFIEWLIKIRKLSRSD